MAQLRKFSKVLVAVDGSEYSMNADLQVSQFDNQRVWFSADCFLCCYIRCSSTISGSSFSPQMEEIKKNAQEFFDKIRRKGDANWDIPLRTELIASSCPESSAGISV